MSEPLPGSVPERIEWARRHLDSESPEMHMFCRGLLAGANGAIDSPFRGLQAIAFIALMDEASTGPMTTVERTVYMIADFARWLVEEGRVVDSSNAEFLAVEYMFWTD